MMDKEHIELARAIAGYLQGVLSKEEAERLEKRAETDDFVRELLDVYRDEAAVAGKLAHLEHIPKEQDWERVKRKHRSKHTGIRKWKWASMAAVLAVLLAAAGWWLYAPQTREGVVPDTVYGHKNDVLPGSNKAVLTLSDGKQVVLEDAKTSQLQDDHVVLNLQEGLLQYQGDIPPAPEQTRHQITVPVGGTYQVMLGDGTNVWINADSRLDFPAVFDTGERRVLVEGEAFFEVAPDPSRPFIVETDGLQIEALGTAFNVNSRKKAGNNAYIKTILTEGKIRVRSGRAEEVISPGYAVRSGPGGMQVEAADPEEALAWKEGYFYFNKKNMQEILEEVARWYGVEVAGTVAGDHKRYTGSVKRSSTLGGVCAMLSDLSGNSFSIEGKKLTVHQ